MSGSWMNTIGAVLTGIDDDQDGVLVDRPRVRPGVNAYIVPSFNRAALLFSLPIRVERKLDPDGRGSDGLDGVAAVAVEAVRVAARDPSVADLDPLAGRGTGYPDRCTVPIDPYTLIASPAAIGGGLFRASTDNRALPNGLALNHTRALPPAQAPDPSAVRNAAERIGRLIGAVGAVIHGLSQQELECGGLASLDQKGLRQTLPSMGLVGFIGDGTRPARDYTRLRPHYRVAGPGRDPHVAFHCPGGLDLLTAEADRIRILEGFRVNAINRSAFR